MNEQEKKAEENQSGEATQNIDGGSKPQAKSIIEQAKEERELLAKENERLEKNIAEMREIEANKMLAGTAGGHIETTPVAPATPTAAEFKADMERIGW